MIPDLHTDFSGGRSGGLIFPSLSEFSQFIVIHTFKDFGIVKEAEIDVFLELSHFFDDPTDVGNLISDSFAFSKTSLNIWKFTVHIFLKPQLKSFAASSIDLCGNPKEWMSRLLFPYILAYKYSTILSVQFSRSVVSDYLRPHESQHARPPCPSPSPRVHSVSRPSSP